MRELFAIAEAGGDGATEDARERAKKVLECLREAGATMPQRGEEQVPPRTTMRSCCSWLRM
jgi:hypothetical protein